MNSRTMASNRTPDHGVLDRFSRSDNQRMPSLRQLNDSVYEFYSPQERTSFSLEIIFFHGLERGDYSKAYMETWTSILETTVVCWPKTLLAKEFCRARILSVSYDSSMEKGPKHGNLDLYVTAENLVKDLLDDAKVAANLGLPVILVGKDFGGLVIKAICMEAKAKNKSTFLSNLKGVFYYGTPHVGIKNFPTAFNGVLAERLKFGDEEIARLGFNFSNYRKERKWATRAIISRQEREKMPELVISESSQRYDVDECYTPNEDIDTVCKSQTGSSSSFKFLTRFISHIESVELKLKNSPDQGQSKVGFKTLLGFGHDGYYVPMVKTLAEVKNALQGARIVVLHGDPGSGKSSLVRYLALQFEAAAQQHGTGVVAPCIAEQSFWLPNGVVYMTCGDRAETTSLQRELLRRFDIEVPLLQDMSTASQGLAEPQKRLHQALVEHLSKLHSCVLVVLDNVWERDHLENLLVPGDRVRYLLTTQISTLWNAHDSKSVQMQDVTLEDARHILGNYAKFEGGVISEDLENLSDEIIAATESHPLALATLGNVLNIMGRNVKDWQHVKGNLKEYLETKDYPPSSFGQNYPLSVDASMMVVLNFVDEDAKNLLYNIALFDGPLVPEPVLLLFLTCMPPRDKKRKINKSTMSLVAKGLVRIETEEKVTSSTSSSEGDDISEGDDMRVVWIHSLRQHFILTTKKEEISGITAFLDDDYDYHSSQFEERSKYDLAIALCALYGATDIKRRAVQKMGSHFIERHSQLASALKPFVPLMSREEDTERPTPISQAAVDVFLEYAWKRQLDDENISYLLKLTSCPSALLATLSALDDIFYIECDSIEEVKLIHEDHLRFVGVLLSLIGSRDNAHGTIEDKTPSRTPQIQICACRAFCNILAKAQQEKSTIFYAECALSGLVRSLSEHDNPTLQEYAAVALQNLACGDADTNLKICNEEGALSGLVRSLSEHDNRPLQEYAAGALQNLALRDADIKIKICNEEGALSGLVLSLSEHDNRPLQEHAAKALGNLANGDADIKLKICNAEGALSGLVRSLSEHDNRPLQEHAAKALGNLANGDADIKLKICNAEGALSGLVRSLSEHDNRPLQEEAAAALQALACGHADIQLKICNEEGALSGLVRSLSEHDNRPLQEHAAKALQNLAGGDANIQLKICNEEGALSGLVRSLSEDDNRPLQEHAAAALQNLACGDADIQLKICNEEGALSGLVRSLSEHDNRPLQEEAAAALRNLACGHADIQLKICNEEGALSGLVRSLSEHDNRPLQEEAAAALQALACGHADIQLKICNEEGALSGLVRSLSEHDNPPLQEHAAAALHALAGGDANIQLKICNEEGALSGLVRSLSEHDNLPLQESAAVALGNLACGGADIKSKICNEEGALSGLVLSLSEHDNRPLQEEAAAALQALACGHADIQLKICNEEGALSGLVRSLSEHDNRPLQEHAAKALQNLAGGDANIQLKICNEEGSLSGLVRSLSEDDNRPLQEHAAAALQNLACGDADIQLKIYNEEGALSGLVRSLSEHENRPLQEEAAAALRNLACGHADIQLKICNEEGALSGLVRSLSEDDNRPLQEHAAAALQNLACGDADIQLKICNEEGALSGLVRSLSEHDNRPLQEEAAAALQALACGHADIQLKICNEEGALSGLVRSLSEHDNRPLQEHAAKALQNLASDDANIQLKICNEEGALSGLVRSLSEHDNPPLQGSAAATLEGLALHVASARKVCDVPGSVGALGQSLSARNNPDLQIATAFTLGNLANRGGDFKLKICHGEGVLSGLVKLLFQEENTDVQEAAAWALENLASQGETVQLKVANEKGAMEGLLRALSLDDKPVLQKKAILALKSLAKVAGESIKLKIAKEEGAVAHLMKLSKDKNPELRMPATGLVVTLGLDGSKGSWTPHFLRFFGSCSVMSCRNLDQIADK